MKKTLLKTANRLLAPLGLELRRRGTRETVAYQQVHDPASSHMLEAAHQGALLDELAETARGAFDELGLANMQPGFDVRGEVDRFWELYRGRPFRDNRGGSGFHNAFWLFLFARALEPELVVESGVWRGHTTWLLRQACPGARLHGFDTNLGRLEYRGDERAAFHEMDWEGFDFGEFDTQRALVFFDCHVNHAQRILQAAEKGFRHLLFDDNPPLHGLYGYGSPGFPTASMVFEGQDDPSHVSWVWQGQPRRASLEPGELQAARKMVGRHFTFPDVGGPTRYGGFSFLTYVELINF